MAYWINFWSNRQSFLKQEKILCPTKMFLVLLKLIENKNLKTYFYRLLNFDSQLNFSVCSSTWTLIRTLFLVLLNHIGSYLYHLQSSQIKTHVWVCFQKFFNSTLLGIRHQKLELNFGSYLAIFWVLPRPSFGTVQARTHFWGLLIQSDNFPFHGEPWFCLVSIFN